MDGTDGIDIINGLEMRKKLILFLGERGLWNSGSKVSPPEEGLFALKCENGKLSSVHFGVKTGQLKQRLRRSLVIQLLMSSCQVI
jgi:hypothetical protein